MIPNNTKDFKTFSMGSCHLSRHISVSHTIYERRAFMPRIWKFTWQGCW